MRATTGDPGQLGGIITGWLLRLAVVFTIVGVLVYDALAVAVTTFALDDTGRQVARSASEEYRATRSLAQATERARREAALDEAAVTAVTEDETELVVELERGAPTLVAHRVAALEDLVTVRVTARTDLAS